MADQESNKGGQRVQTEGYRPQGQKGYQPASGSAPDPKLQPPKGGSAVQPPQNGSQTKPGA